MMTNPSAARTCVVICYYVGQPIKVLHYLLGHMQRFDAGAPFRVVIVVNGGDKRPLKLPARYASLNAQVINRVNHGYNIEAWDVGWRSAPDHEFYLFLQAECYLRKANWVADFEFRMEHDQGVGLLGEFYFWEHQTWTFIRQSTDRDLGNSVWPPDEPTHPIDTIRLLMEQKGLPLTTTGTHLSAIVLFTSRAILEEVGGFPLIGSSYREASASEIAFSRIIEDRGYRLSRVRGGDFKVIGHRQHSMKPSLKTRLRASARAVAKKLGLKK